MFKTKKINSGNVEVLMGKESFFEGTLKSSGIVRIDGKIEGALEVEGDLIVGVSGEIIGEIRASNVALAGSVKGNIYVEQKMEINKTGRLEGDIRANSLIIEEGGVFHGTSLRSEEEGKEQEKE
ncbi:bactofilin family protein [Candidatus Contubernalis alkaliaceticus]|uniref:bactofilin family protein n=1 Tax=Candidatus Contubernalis alkaliaceticus TaxID=338645 RepID=UPI001F4C10D9|nr:polymer-forming cytoskeletal protein [Candidatus Contubernalis alkalaceticus]UNC93721.1 polymer-forming cytoskeletal protein [Candidatus Contubernalis alkalaceticus]